MSIRIASSPGFFLRLLLSLGLLAGGAAGQEGDSSPDALLVLSEINRARLAASWSFTVLLRHQEDGQEFSRKLGVQWAAWPEGIATLVSVREPDTLAGTALLRHESTDPESEPRAWAFFPVPHPLAFPIPVKAVSQRVLGSLFTHWDLQRLTSPRDFYLTVRERNARWTIIEGRPKARFASDLDWDCVRWFVDNAISEISRTEFFLDGKLVRTTEVVAWHRDGDAQIPRQQTVKDLRTGTASDLILQEVAKVPEFPRAEFEIDAVRESVARMRRGD